MLVVAHKGRTKRDIEVDVDVDVGVKGCCWAC
jgi:hypothetical protein